MGVHPASAVLAAALLALSAPASAWGYEGHRVVADIARGYLTPAVRAKVDAILAVDTTALTGHDMASEATWADAYRGAGHRETAQWHFVDQEIDGSADLKAACFGFPAAGADASAGPARDCVVDKIDEFATELAAPATSPAERLVALKFLLHFIGDVNQPLHASDNHDRGGNCVLLALGGTRTVNLHAFWDTGVVEALGRDPDQVARTLRARITPAQAAAWRGGNAADWARESFQIARSTAYTIGSAAGCQSDAAPIEPSANYWAAAVDAAALQLEKAGVRLAAVLNRALSGVVVPTPTAIAPADRGTATVQRDPPSNGTNGRTPLSLRCSAEADARNLHGSERKQYRRLCMRERDPT